MLLWTAKRLISVVTGIRHWYQVIRQAAKFFHLLCCFERSAASPLDEPSPLPRTADSDRLCLGPRPVTPLLVSAAKRGPTSKTLEPCEYFLNPTDFFRSRALTKKSDLIFRFRSNAPGTWFQKYRVKLRGC